MSVIIHQHQMGVHSLATLNNAIIGGAVAVTAGCAYYESWSSIVLGIITSLVNYYGPHLMISLRIDDPLDAFVCHGMNGLVGILGVGLFAYKDFVPEGHRYGVVYEGGSISLLGIQLVGSLFLMSFCAVVMWLTLLLTRWYFTVVLEDKDGLRIDKTAEILGMDIKYYDGYAYPDFNKSKVLQVLTTTLSSHFSASPLSLCLSLCLSLSLSLCHCLSLSGAVQRCEGGGDEGAEDEHQEEGGGRHSFRRESSVEALLLSSHLVH
jgi:hypothetical protein